MATNPYSNVSVSGYNADAPTDDGAQTSNNRITWAKHKTKIGDPLKTAIEAIDQATDDAFATIAAILVDFTGDFGSGGITGLVPAPGAGDAANNRFLRADGTWTTPAGAGSVTSVATGSGLTGGPITGSGTISLATIATNAVLGNLTGATAAPSEVLLPALLNALDVFQGDLGSGGVKGLVPAPAAGEDNLFLRGDGTWAATVDNYSGTVTSITAGSGLSGGAITTSGTISLSAISDQTLLANISGSAAVPTETSIPELTPYLEVFGGDFGSGGERGLVPAPLAGDAAAGKVLYADGTWAVPPGSGGGEANTASNLGSGEGIFAAKSGIDLQLKSLVAGTGVSLSSDGTTVTINGSSSVSVFIGDAGSGGVAGIVPAPAAGDDGKFLKGDGTWSNLLPTVDIGSTDATLSRLFAGGLAVEGALISSHLLFRLNADLAGSNATGAQEIFGVGVTLAGSTVYAFEMDFILAKSAGTTSHTITLSFGGTATLNNIYFQNQVNATAAAATVGATVINTGFYAAAGGVTTNAITTASTEYRAKITGTVSINSGGTFIPQYALSAAPGGAYSTKAGSIVSIRPIGASGADTNIGSWA